MTDVPRRRYPRRDAGILATSERLEWLVTNGLGGFAMGTVAGLDTRRYHGLLVAALAPPLGRTVMAKRVDEIVTYRGTTYSLGANRWWGGSAVDPRGFELLEHFELDGRIPVWRWALADAILEKRVTMVQWANTTVVHYRLVRASAPVDLRIKLLVGYRDFHSLTSAGDWEMDVARDGVDVVVTAFAGARPLRVSGDGLELAPVHEWYRGYHLAREAKRGLDGVDDALHAVTATATLDSDAAVALGLSADDQSVGAGRAHLDAARHRDRSLLETADATDVATQRLVLAADQFIVQRGTGDTSGATVIAGYPWFGDWGRDTMIALRGLTLATGRAEVAKDVLETFARFVDQGMLPNRFPDGDSPPEYNTVDATLWYFDAIRLYVERTKDTAFAEAIWPVLTDIISWHDKGTRYGIGVDPDDGLLSAGVPGVQLTWMDAKVGDWVVTPRQGKCVEINALWLNALSTMALLAPHAGASAAPWTERSARVSTSFGRFFNSELGYCYDVLDGPEGNDPSLRPNQLFAVSLADSPLSDEQQRSVVDACAAALVTGHGVRSLAPNHTDYVGHYGGDSRSRDGSYHQGTVWGWLLGPFALAHYRVYGDAELAKSFVQPLIDQLDAHGLGSLAEIFDGEPPHVGRGCPAQAWSVAETLWAWRLLGEATGF